LIAVSSVRGRSMRASNAGGPPAAVARADLGSAEPDIVAAVLDDTLPNHITLFEPAVDPPALWDAQRWRVGV
jgi:hypothetical protein